MFIFFSLLEIIFSLILFIHNLTCYECNNIVILMHAVSHMIYMDY